MNLKSILFIFLSISISVAKVVYVVPIQGTIDLGLPPFIERVISKAETSGADGVIFDIDTFGGRVDAATQIKDAILDADLLTAAFINRRAISAGALISLSCEKIYITGGGTIGAATAVDMSGKKGSEKVISYMREEMASTAEKRGRNIDIAKGMVDEDLFFTHLLVDSDSVLVEDLEGRKEGKLITLTTEQAIKYNIADGKTETLNDLLKLLGLEDAEIRNVDVNWSENIVRFLTDPVVASLLMTFGFLGILFELQSPGWGIPGTFGAVCLTLSLGASTIAELATMTDLLIVLAGLALLFIEGFLIPGFGFAGVAGVSVLIFGIYKLLIPEIPVEEDVYSRALDGMVIGVVGGLIALILLFRLMIKTKFWNKLTSPGVQSKDEGYSVSIGLEEFVGKTGESTSDLRPSGWVIIKDKKIFVVSEGEYIQKGEKVSILSVDGNRVVVRKESSNLKE
mgnify:CR=1 FL=1